MKIEITSNPLKKEKDFLNKSLTSFNESKIPDLHKQNGIIFYSFMRDSDENLIGGIKADWWDKS